MFVDLVPNPRTLARAALTVAYLGLMVIMTVVAWQGGKIDLSSVGQIASALAAALLGGVINPSGSKKATSTASTASTASAAPARPVPAGVSSVVGAGAGDTAGAGGAARETDAFWALQTVVGCAALLMTALALAVDGSGHTNAPAAFVAVAAAFSALFLDTRGVTHPLTGTPETEDKGGVIGEAASSGAGSNTKAQIPAQSTGSADDAESPNS